jgi:lysozyme family protein
MQGNFEKAVKFVLDHEGGYVFNPLDPGGETNYGISKRSYPNQDIKALTIDQAKAIYQKDYWDRMGCDKIASGLDIVAFDTAVNCGVGRALQWLTLVHDWRDFLMLRLAHYAGLDSFRNFGLGWANRVLDLWKMLIQFS